MAREAELHDGTVLEFPDDTADDVIDRVVKQHLGVSAPNAAPSAKPALDAPAQAPTASELARAAKPAQATRTRGGQAQFDVAQPAPAMAAPGFGESVMKGVKTATAPAERASAVAPISAGSMDAMRKAAADTPPEAASGAQRYQGENVMRRGTAEAVAANARAPETVQSAYAGKTTRPKLEAEAAPFMESVKAVPAAARAGTGKMLADTPRFLKALDQQVVALTQLRGELDRGKTRQPELAAEYDDRIQHLDKRLIEVKADIERSRMVSGQFEEDLKAAKPKNESFVGGALTSAAASAVPTLGGLATGLVTRSPGAAMAVAGVGGGAAQGAGSHAEVADLAIENQRRLPELRAAPSKIQYAMTVLADEGANPLWRKVAGQLSDEIGQLSEKRKLGLISMAQERVQKNRAIEKYTTTMEDIGQRATAGAAVLQGVGDAILEGVGEKIGLGVALRQGTPLFTRITQTAAAEFGQEFATQLMQTLHAYLRYNPTITIQEALPEALQAGLAGAFMGGPVAAAGHAIDAANARRGERLEQTAQAATASLAAAKPSPMAAAVSSAMDAGTAQAPAVAVAGQRQQPTVTPGTLGDLDATMRDSRSLKEIRQEQAAQETERQGGVNTQIAAQGSATALADGEAQDQALQTAGALPGGSDVVVETGGETLRGKVSRASVVDGEAVYQIQAEDGTTIDTQGTDAVVTRAPAGDGTKAAPVQIESAQDLQHARDQIDQERTDAQILAGNDKKGHAVFQGLPVTLENGRGDVRTNKGGGPKWSVVMPADYGYIKGTESSDGEQVDVYLGANPEAPHVWVVDQIDPATMEPDEPKALMGFDSEEQALGTYFGGFSDNSGPKRAGAVNQMTVAEFKQWLKSGTTKTPISYVKEASDGIPDEQGQVPGSTGGAEVPGRGTDAADVEAGTASEGNAAAAPGQPAERAGDQPVPRTQVAVRSGPGALEARNAPNTVFREARGLNDQRLLGVFTARYDGTQQGAIEAAQEVSRQMFAEFPDAGNMVSRMGATDEDGRAKWMISPNFAHLPHVSTQEARELGFGVDADAHFGIAPPRSPAAERRAANKAAIEQPVLQKSGAPAPAAEVATLQNSATSPRLMYREGKHTKTGAPLHVVKVGVRVSRDEYLALKDRAAAQGGKWSKFAKGFLFPSQDKARAFIGGTPGVSKAEVSSPPAVSNQPETVDLTIQSLRPGAAPETVTVAKSPGKPVTPQVPALPGMAPIGAQEGPKKAPVAAADAAAVSADDFNTLIDEVIAERAPSPAAARRQANAALRDAGGHAAGAVKEGLAGLDALFGRKGTLGMGPAFDEETYAKAKPHFEAAYREFVAAGKSLKDYVKFIIQTYNDAIVPYLKRWHQDLQGGDNAGLRPDIRTGAEGAQPAGVQTPEGERETAGNAPADQGGVRPGGSAPDQGAGRQTVRDIQQASGEAERGAQLGTGATAKSAHGAGRTATGVNYRITAEDAIGKGGAKHKARSNIHAIRTAKLVQKEARLATQEEKADLVKYVGWGASELINGIFPDPVTGNYKSGWEDMGRELKAILTPAEYESASASGLNAHYTSPEIIRGMYHALERFGFQSGKIFEPGMGVGHFVGLMPAGMEPHSSYTGVELDKMTGLIASQLYPKANVRVQDFTTFKVPPNFYDVSLGNPPFADIEILSDDAYKKYKFKLHDYFFAKSIDQTRPGGILMFVTSKGTMDKQSDVARSYLAERADLLGAIRLPQTAFKENAGTEVVTDVIFMRKRLPGESPAGEAWQGLASVDTPEGAANVNEYFAAHPEMVLGEHRLTGTMYRKGSYTVEPKAGDIGKQFIEAANRLPADVYTPAPVSQAFDSAAVEAAEIAPETIKEGAYYLNDKGEVLQRIDGVGVPPERAQTHKEIIKLFVPLRDAARKVLHVQLTEGDLPAAQKELGKAYDAFVKRFGPVNKEIRREFTDKKGLERVAITYPNIGAFKEDPDAYRVASLERYDSETGKATKAPIFTERVINPDVAPKIATVSDALNVTLNDKGFVDMPEIARLMGMTEADAADALGNAVWLNPGTGAWETEDDYLSGNVRNKLKIAQGALADDSRYQRNVDALTAVIPPDKPPSRITASLGAPWIDSKYVQQFARQALTFESARIEHMANIGSWTVQASNTDTSSAAATSDWGTRRRNGVRLLSDALNSTQPIVYDAVMDDGKEKLVRNDTETQAAQEKLQQIKNAFRSWIWEDVQRAEILARKFNDEFNNTRKRQFNGNHMTLPGISSAFQINPHQKQVAWRVVQTGNTYIAHGVGAGKTIESAIAGMEMKRLGIKKKSGFVVPNHMLKQYAAEFLAVYPAAKILVADEENFKADRRKRFMGKISSENWDAIIITHAAFKKIPISPEFEEKFIDDIVEEYRAMLTSIDKSERLKRKQIERGLKRFEERLARLQAKGARDKGVSFEETGIDFLFVDEAQEMRKLQFVTNQTGIKGIDPMGSQRAWDLYMKSRYIETLSPGRSLALMSGTPITNTIGEMFTIQRYLSEQVLREHGLHNFDAWSAQFGDMVTRLEATPAGTYKPVTRFAEFKNLGALSQMWGEIGDVVKVSDLPYIKRPNVKGGGREIVQGDVTAAQRAYRNVLNERLKAIKARKGPPSKGDDIVLRVITDGRHAAIDQRFIDSDLPGDPQSKLEKLIDNTFEIWGRTKGDRLTQMIFADLGTPSAQDRRGFSSYLHIRDSLIARGVPRDEIAFMQDYSKSDAKLRLFKDMNSGKKRILIGSSVAMGTGVNAQRLLFALHHLDAPWIPADVEQREGRIVRQGNTNPEVELYAYVTKGSYDETMWQFLETKQRFIDQLLSGDADIDSASDVDASADQFALVRAMSSENPLVIEKAGLESDLQRLTALQRSHFDSQLNLKRTVASYGAEIPHYEDRIAKLEATVAKLVDLSADKFLMKVGDNIYSDRKTAGTAFIEAAEAAIAKDSAKHTAKTIGEIGGLPIRITTRGHWPKGDPMHPIIVVGGDGNVAEAIDYSPGKMNEGSMAIVLENAYGRFRKTLERARDELAGAQKKVSEAEQRIGRTFEHASALEEKQKRLDEINGELSAQAAADQPVTDGQIDDGDDAQEEVDDGENLSLGVNRHRNFSKLTADEAEELSLADLAQAIEYYQSKANLDARGTGYKSDADIMLDFLEDLQDSRRDGTLDPTNPDITADVGDTFSERYLANAEEVAKRVHAIAQQIAPQANLRTVNSLFYGDRPVAGAHSASRNLIRVALNYHDPESTVRHEAVHALRALGLFTEAEWSVLERESRAKWREQYNIDSRYKGVTESDGVLTEEGITNAFQAYRNGEKFGGLVLRAFAKMREFFTRVGNMLQGMGFQTYEDVFRRIESGEVGNRPMSVRQYARLEPAFLKSVADDLNGVLDKLSVGQSGDTDPAIDALELRLNEKYPKAHTVLYPYADAIEAEIEVRDEADEGKGLVVRPIKELLAWADAHDKGVLIQAYPRDEVKMPLARLVALYQRFGFVPFGEQETPFATMMYRDSPSQRAENAEASQPARDAPEAPPDGETGAGDREPDEAALSYGERQARAADEERLALGTSPPAPVNITVVKRQESKDIDVFRRFLWTPRDAFAGYPQLAALQQFATKIDTELSKTARRLTHDFDVIRDRLTEPQFDELSAVLWMGDAEATEYTDAELRQGGITDAKVRQAYADMRDLQTKAGRLVDMHRRSMMPQYRARKAALLRQMQRLTNMDDAEFRSLYGKRTRLRAKLRAGLGDPVALGAQLTGIETRMQQIREGLDEYLELQQELDAIDAALAKTSIRKREGYVPHKFFGSYAVYKVTDSEVIDPETLAPAVDANGAPVIEEHHELLAGEHGFYPTLGDALAGAKEAATADPSARLVVRPVQFQFPNSTATTLTDKSYWRLMANMGKQFEIGGQELREAMEDVARRRFRRRIAGFAQMRKGVEGYSRDLERVMRAHLGEVTRYVFLDKLKYRAINDMERMGLSSSRSANQQYGNLAAMVNAYLRDMNGQKQPLETTVDDLLNRPWANPAVAGAVAAAGSAPLFFGITTNPLLGMLLGGYMGYRFYSSLKKGGEFKSRALTGDMISDMAHMKLGAFFNVYSAAVNLTQTVINTLPVLGAQYTLTGMVKLEEAIRTSLMGKPNADYRLLERTDTVSKFQYHDSGNTAFLRDGSLAKWSLYLFTTAEQFNRAVSFLGAYYRARDQGKEPGPAFAAGEAAMLLTQHNYGQSNKPEAMRNVFARLPLQFKNFMAQQLAFTWHLGRIGITGDNRTGVDIPRHAILTHLTSLFLTAGAIGLPLLGLLAAAIKGMFDWDPLEEMKKQAIIAQGKGNMVAAAGNVLSRGAPSLIGDDLSTRAGMGDKFLPMSFQDVQGPWWGTISKAVQLGELQAGWVDQIMNLTGGIGKPLKSIEAAANGLPLTTMITDPKAWFEALADGKINYTNPWKNGYKEFDESGWDKQAVPLNTTDLVRMAAGGTPLKVSQARDVGAIDEALKERDRRMTKMFMGKIINAVRLYEGRDEAKLAEVMARIEAQMAEKDFEPNEKAIAAALKAADTPRLVRVLKSTPKKFKPLIGSMIEGLSGQYPEDETVDVDPASPGRLKKANSGSRRPVP